LLTNKNHDAEQEIQASIDDKQRLVDGHPECRMILNQVKQDNVEDDGQ
jgi:hypothetical protein